MREGYGGTLIAPPAAAAASADPAARSRSRLPRPPGKWSDDSPPALKTCNTKEKKYVGGGEKKQVVAEGTEVVFTYDIVYKPSEIRWATRWDTYLVATDDQVGAGFVVWVGVLRVGLRAGGAAAPPLRPRSPPHPARPHTHTPARRSTGSPLSTR